MIVTRKKIDFEFTAAEKQVLKAKGITLKSISDYAIDEIVTLLNADIHRAKTLRASFIFQSIPSIGIRFAHDLMLLGYYSLTSLKNKTGPELLNDYEKAIGYRVDPCVEDQFWLVVHNASHVHSVKKWWDFTTERKAFRSQYGYPADRP